MDIENFDKLQKERKVEQVKTREFEGDLPILPEGKSLETDYPTLLHALRTVRQPISTAPTFTPRSFAEQIQFYENGATYRLYVYVNATWRYVALT